MNVTNYYSSSKMISYLHFFYFQQLTMLNLRENRLTNLPATMGKVFISCCIVMQRLLPLLKYTIFHYISSKPIQGQFCFIFKWSTTTIYTQGFTFSHCLHSYNDQTLFLIRLIHAEFCNTILIVLLSRAKFVNSSSIKQHYKQRIMEICLNKYECLRE